MSKGTAACLGCLIAIAIWVGLGALISWGIEWAWNTVMPTLLHWPRIDFAMACAIYFLLSVIVGFVGKLLHGES